MIIDKIQLAGLDAYLQDLQHPGQTNLAGQARARTTPLGKGRQLDISGIELLIETDGDLADLFNLDLDAEANPPALKPLFSVTVMKEMFPALFANPFQHRVHNIGGYEDFKRGTVENGKAMEVDGIPTLVSIGEGTCKWTSTLYPMPEPVRLNHAAWEVAASRKTDADYFQYSLKLFPFDSNHHPLAPVLLADGVDPTRERTAEELDLKDIAAYGLEFSADVKKDAALYEKHTTLVGQSIGTPLLRAINLLESVESVYNIYSLQELLRLSSNYHLFEFQGQPIKKMTATLDLSATLVHSENENIALADLNDPTSANDPISYGDPDSFYEFIEITVNTDQFSNFQARLVGEEIVRSTDDRR